MKGIHRRLVLTLASLGVAVFGVQAARAQFAAPTCLPPNCNPSVIQNIPSASAPQTADINITGDVKAGTFAGNGANLTALNATQLTTGILPSGRLSGTYAGALTWSGNNIYSGMSSFGSAALVLTGAQNLLYGNIDTTSTGSLLLLQNESVDKFKVDAGGTLTVGLVPWTRLNAFPVACPAGQYASAVGGTLTCSTPAFAEADTLQTVTNRGNATTKTLGVGGAAAIASTGLNAIASNTGVFGETTGAGVAAVGVFGKNSSIGPGVEGTSSSGPGVYGISTSGIGGNFSGSTGVAGTGTTYGGQFSGTVGILTSGATALQAIGNVVVAGMSTFGQADFVVGAGQNLLYGNVDTTSSGNLLLLQNESVDKFKVNAAGNLTVAGTGAFTGNLTVAGQSVCRADGTNCPPSGGVSGTPDYITKFTGSGNTVGNSMIFEDTGNGRIGIGTTVPGRKFEVRNGDIGTYSGNIAASFGSVSGYIVANGGVGISGQAVGSGTYGAVGVASTGVAGYGQSYGGWFTAAYNFGGAGLYAEWTGNAGSLGKALQAFTDRPAATAGYFEATDASNGNTRGLYVSTPYTAGGKALTVIGDSYFSHDIWVNSTARLSELGSDPAAAEGSLAYVNNKFRCNENNSWKDCIGAGIGGGGTNNFIPKFTPNGTTLGNSQIYDDGTNIGIAGTAFSKLDVYGNVNLRGNVGMAGQPPTAGYGLIAGLNVPASDTGIYGVGANYGVKGSAGSYGIYGQGGVYGVYGTGTAYGAYGFASGGGGYGGYFATASAGSEGVHARASAPATTAVYAEGNMIVTGNTTLGDNWTDTLTFNNSTATIVPGYLNIDSNTLYIDAANNRVGIGTAVPTNALEVGGTFRVNGSGTAATIITTGAGTGAYGYGGQIGVRGEGTGYGGLFEATAANSIGVRGNNLATGGYGIWGTSTGSGGYGVYANSSGPNSYGVYSVGTLYAFYGSGNSYLTGQMAVGGASINASTGISTQGTSYGLDGVSTSGGYGVRGTGQVGVGGIGGQFGVTGTGTLYGVYGTSGTANGVGLFGNCSGTNCYGVYGVAGGSGGSGVVALQNSGSYALQAIGTSYFSGNIMAEGNTYGSDQGWRSCGAGTSGYCTCPNGSFVGEIYRSIPDSGWSGSTQVHCWKL